MDVFFNKTLRITLLGVEKNVFSMAEHSSSRPVITTISSSNLEERMSGNGIPWYERKPMLKVPGYLVLAEVVLGLLVWVLVASTDYFRFSSFGWVMFVTVFYWILTLFLFIINLTNGRIKQAHWSTAVLAFNCSAAALYTSAAIVQAQLVNLGLNNLHDYGCWAASTLISFLVSLSYVGSAFFSFKSWKRREQ